MSGTVWNHIGKKYMIAKLQFATKKLLTPTKTGTFCASKNGASIGSGATNSSKRTNDMKKTMDKTKGIITEA